MYKREQPHIVMGDKIKYPNRHSCSYDILANSLLRYYSDNNATTFITNANSTGI